MTPISKNEILGITTKQRHNKHLGSGTLHCCTPCAQQAACMQPTCTALLQLQHHCITNNMSQQHKHTAAIDGLLPSFCLILCCTHAWQRACAAAASHHTTHHHRFQLLLNRNVVTFTRKILCTTSSNPCCRTVSTTCCCPQTTPKCYPISLGPQKQRSAKVQACPKPHIGGHALLQTWAQPPRPLALTRASTVTSMHNLTLMAGAGKRLSHWQ